MPYEVAWTRIVAHRVAGGAAEQPVAAVVIGTMAWSSWSAVVDESRTDEPTELSTPMTVNGTPSMVRSGRPGPGPEELLGRGRAEHGHVAAWSVTS